MRASTARCAWNSARSYERDTQLVELASSTAFCTSPFSCNMEGFEKNKVEIITMQYKQKLKHSFNHKCYVR
jgi:hypothetical protein